jgi:hypothetical protein
MAPAIAAAASGRGGRRPMPLGQGGRTAGRPTRGSPAVPTTATLGRRGLAAVRRAVVVVVAEAAAVEAAVGDFDFEPRVAEARSVCCRPTVFKVQFTLFNKNDSFRINYSNGRRELIDRIYVKKIITKL